MSIRCTNLSVCIALLVTSTTCLNGSLIGDISALSCAASMIFWFFSNMGAAPAITSAVLKSL
ncbi:hypothetical protein C8J57DRAFT_1342719 [Mycena rebaudengoi]|nr:hypothetical protein C8J57DRAFT_1342719 [Mycena rebaudengoi]